jgi:putative ABC transport system substrate-binding protein
VLALARSDQGDQMNRRDTVLALIALGSTPFFALAQSAPLRVAWISPTPAADGSPFLDELRRGLREFGYLEGRNLVLEPYWGDNTAARLEKMTAEAIASAPRVIVAQGGAAPVARRATTTIPVVFAYSGDPVEAGLVESFARPQRNMTGISYLALELVGKRIELLKEAIPSVRRIAVVANPSHAGDSSERKASQAAASKLGLSLEYYEVSNATQLGEAMTAIEKTRSDAVMLFPVQNIINNRERIAAWSLKNRLPTMSGWAQFADGGNMMSYGPNLREASRRLAYYVDRILKGTKPADLPVELPTQVEFVVNRKTANALGLTLPRAVLVRADRVIE